MALEAANFDGAVFFRASPSVDGEHVVFSLLSKVPSSVSVVTIKGRRRSLLQRYGQKLSETTQFVYFSEQSSLDSILSEVPPGVCVLDCADVLISVLGVDNAAKLVHRLKGTRLVVANFPSSTVSESEWNRLCSVTDSHFSLDADKSQIIATGVSYKKNGKRIAIKESVQVLPDLKIKSRKVEEAAAPVETVAEPTISAPFNMGFVLKETERAAKEQMQLPYMSSSNVEGLVTLRSSDKKVRVGGQIIYTPDEGDDLDDSDPDDDLNL